MLGKEYARLKHKSRLKLVQSDIKKTNLLSNMYSFKSHLTHSIIKGFANILLIFLCIELNIDLLNDYEADVISRTQLIVDLRHFTQNQIIIIPFLSLSARNF